MVEERKYRLTAKTAPKERAKTRDLFLTRRRITLTAGRLLFFFFTTAAEPRDPGAHEYII
jgi:hypothetical protein